MNNNIWKRFLGNTKSHFPKNWENPSWRLKKSLYQLIFLATLVALHLTPVSETLGGQSFGLQPSSVAWSLFFKGSMSVLSLAAQ